MKILLSMYLKNKQESQYVNSLVSLLNSLCDDVRLLISGQKNLSTDQLINTDIDKFLPDLVIAFNRAGLRKVEKLNRNWKVPVVYSFCNSDFVKEYDELWNQWDNLIIIDNDNNINKKNFPDKLTTFLKLPDPIKDAVPYKQGNKNPIIQIEFDGLMKPFSLLLEIAPVINSLTNIKFQISGGGTHNGYFNRNIQFNAAFFENDVVDLIIGSGKAIEKAVVNSKPCIVVGARGYGGLITKSNFERQYASGFQGRIGGEIGEYIPEKLLIEEILDFFELEESQVTEIISTNRRLMQKQFNIISEQLSKTLNKVVEDHITINEKLNYAKLQFSKFFNLISINEKQCKLQKIHTKQFHSIVDMEEQIIIREFGDGNLVNDVLAKYGYNNDAENFLEFVKGLLNEKILIISE